MNVKKVKKDELYCFHASFQRYRRMSCSVCIIIKIMTQQRTCSKMKQQFKNCINLKRKPFSYCSLLIFCDGSIYYIVTLKVMEYYQSNTYFIFILLLRPKEAVGISSHTSVLSQFPLRHVVMSILWFVARTAKNTFWVYLLFSIVQTCYTNKIKTRHTKSTDTICNFLRLFWEISLFWLEAIERNLILGYNFSFALW